MICNRLGDITNKRTMKRILILLFVAASTAMMAQSSKVVSAYNYFKSQEYGKAAEYIDQAIENEKTMIQEKTWRYRGDIYKQIAISNEDFGIDKGAAAETALISYEKALELDKKKRYADLSSTGSSQSRNLIVNMGIEAYNEQDYAKAQKLFSTGADAAVRMGFMDTLAVYNAGLAAEQGKDYENAIKYYQQAADAGYLGPKMYLYMANLHQQNEDNEAYLAVVRAGREKYPEDGDLIVYELNYYLRNGQFEEAENNLKLAIEKEPENKQLHFSLGVVYDNLGDNDKAVAAYESAIAIDPNYFDAVYNLGALYFNTGVEMNNAANEIQDNAAYNKAREEAKQVFLQAQPHLEKAHELDPEDMGAIKSLSQLYALIGDNEKYKEMKAKMGQ